MSANGGRRQFFPSDVRVTEHQEAFDSQLLHTLSERLQGLASSFNRYREDQLSPGSVYDTWVQPSTSAGPSAYGGTLLIDHDLGFPAHSVAVDNPTSQWLHVEPCNRDVPPYTLGWVYPVVSGGAQNARVLARTPPGLAAFAAVSGETAYVAWHEAHLRPAAGTPVAPSQIAATIAVTDNGLKASLPPGATPIEATSGFVANAAAAAVLAAAAGKTTYITGFEITSDGATAVLIVQATVGVLTGSVTEGYTYTAVAGATTQDLTLAVEYARGIPANAVNSAITVNLPALGPGNTSAIVNAHGYQL